MIEKMLIEIKKYLPLEIIKIEYTFNENILNIGGKNWFFTALYTWRISSDKMVIAGCYDPDNREYLEEVKGLKIVDLAFQGKILKVDPVFILSNGKRLEIFSTNISKPWTLEIKGVGSYSATPNEPDTFHKEI